MKVGNIALAEQIGTETTTHVRNIYKYYVANRLTLGAQETARKAREQVGALEVTARWRTISIL